MIHFGAVMIPAGEGVADIVYRNQELGESNPVADAASNTGLFYTLHGREVNLGLQAAWAWRVSRIIDAIELVPESGIDPTHLGITGCSRDSRSSLTAGTFDNQIALIIPQEGGEGSDACWRITEYEKAATSFPCRPLPCETQDCRLR